MFDPVQYDLWSNSSVNDKVNWYILKKYSQYIDWSNIIKTYNLSNEFKEEFKVELGNRLG